MAAPAPAHLYLRVEGGLSWVYCDRDTSFALVDALALLRPRSVRAAGRAPNAAQRARQHAAFEKDIMRRTCATGAAGAAPPSRGTRSPRLAADYTAPVVTGGTTKGGTRPPWNRVPRRLRPELWPCMAAWRGRP